MNAGSVSKTFVAIHSFVAPRKANGQLLSPTYVLLDWLKWLRDRQLDDLPSTAHRLLLEIVRHFGTRSHIGFPGVATLAARIGRSERAVQYNLKLILNHPNAPIQRLLRGQRKTPIYAFTPAAYACCKSIQWPIDGVQFSNASGAEIGVCIQGSNSVHELPGDKTPAEVEDAPRANTAEPPPRDPDPPANVVARVVEYRYAHIERVPTPIERRQDEMLVRARIAEGVTEVDLKAAVRGCLHDPFAKSQGRARLSFWAWGKHDRTIELAMKAPPPPAWEVAGMGRLEWEAREAAEKAERDAKIMAVLERRSRGRS